MLRKLLADVKQQSCIWLSLLWFYLCSGRYTKTMAVIMVSVVTIAGAYLVGYLTSEHRYRDVEKALYGLAQEMGLESAGRSLDAQLSMVRREMDIMEETAKELKNLIYENTLVIDDLKEQIYFYKSVVAPEELEKSLSIFDISVLEPVESGRYPVEVVLRKAQKQNVLTTGHVKIAMYGKNDADQSVSQAGEPMQFSFRYFQRVHGTLTVPEGFSPEKVLVSVVANRDQSFEETYTWKDIVAADVSPSGS